MKKLILALAVCYAFCVQGIATNSDAKLNDIEIAQGKINVLKAERGKIYNKLSPIRDEMGVIMEKKRTLKEKIISLERGVLGIPYYKALIEKKENDVKNLTPFAAASLLFFLPFQAT
jgi:peptidoglycan hydrolase CwlO-like protein